MKLVLFSIIIACFTSLVVSEGLGDFIHNYYGSCAPKCASDANDWLEETYCTDNKNCWCSLHDAAFYQKFVCCISQTEYCSVGMDTVNRDFRQWCSSGTDSATPSQQNTNASLSLPSKCSPSISSTRRSWSDDETDNQYSPRSGDDGLNLSVGALIGIVVAALVILLAVALCVSSCVRRGRGNRHAPPSLPLHTSARLNTLPRRPAAAVVRPPSPRAPPPPYTAKEEAAPQYEMACGGSNNNAVTTQPNT